MIKIAHDINEVLSKQSPGDKYRLLDLNEKVNQFGDAEIIEQGSFMSKLLELLVKETSEVYGEPVFFDGRAAKNAPKWFNYEMVSIWKHGGYEKYVAWVIEDGQASIIIGKK